MLGFLVYVLCSVLCGMVGCQRLGIMRHSNDDIRKIMRLKMLIENLDFLLFNKIIKY